MYFSQTMMWSAIYRYRWNANYNVSHKHRHRHRHTLRRWHRDKDLSQNEGLSAHVWHGQFTKWTAPYLYKHRYCSVFFLYGYIHPNYMTHWTPFFVPLPIFTYFISVKQSAVYLVTSLDIMGHNVKINFTYSMIRWGKHHWSGVIRLLCNPE